MLLTVELSIWTNCNTNTDLVTIIIAEISHITKMDLQKKLSLHVLPKCLFLSQLLPSKLSIVILHFNISNMHYCYNVVVQDGKQAKSVLNDLRNARRYLKTLTSSLVLIQHDVNIHYLQRQTCLNTKLCFRQVLKNIWTYFSYTQ